MATNTVETATGPRPADSLGFVLPHEHLLWADAGWQHDTVPRHDEAWMLEAMVGMLSEAASTGVTTVVDPAPAEMGRNVDLMAAASERTGVAVVFATGLYCRWPTPYFAHRSAAELADYFRHELTTGTGRRGAKAAFVKVAVEDQEFTAHEAAVLEAAAAVHAELDCPILVHCQPGTAQAALRRLTENLGVDGTAVVIGHAESMPDVADQLKIAETYGCYLGFDRFGLETFGVRDEARLRLVIALCKAGYADRLHLSHDYAGANLGRGETVLTQRRESMPTWRVGHLGSAILPRLRGMGVTEEQVKLMTRTAPARWLARRP
jgi:phosphotriesterase-related protein